MTSRASSFEVPSEARSSGAPPSVPRDPSRISSDASKASRVRRHQTVATLRELMEDPDSYVYDVGQSRVVGSSVARYFLQCLAVVASPAVAAVALWSDMGCGERCFDLFEARRAYMVYCLGTAIGLMVLLYLLDFFYPPHLAGSFLTLGSSWVPGRCIFGLAIAAAEVALMLSPSAMPTARLLATIFIGPVGIILLRLLTAPRERYSRSPSGVVSGRVLHERMAMLKALVYEEHDQRRFYVAATCAFAFTGFVSIAVWLPWALGAEAHLVDRLELTSCREEKELVIIRWATPLMVAIADFVIAAIFCMRVILNRIYNKTNVIRNRLMASATTINQDLMDYRIKKLNALLQRAGSGREDLLRTCEDRAQRYLVQHVSHLRQLLNTVKVAFCIFIALLGATYVTLQLSFADSPIASMVQSFLVLTFFTFVVFVYVSFQRLWLTMGDWLMDLPLWKSAISLVQQDWVHAAVLILMIPFVPLLVVLSFSNECVRRCRGLATSGGCLTTRMHAWIDMAGAWDWVAVIAWCYVVAEIMMLYKLCTVLLNVLLSWMTWAIQGLPFVYILLSTFVAGMFLFMLPPVPGPPIYLFGGVVITEACPWGFHWGSFICIVLSFVLKLASSAVQQKLIGEVLGSNLRIRNIVGVHKPFIRAIEVVLRKPGLSFGKCMILCGGPDWPTSVLAGILRLSVLQCLVGTVPILFTIAPLCLTGSLYLRREESEVWLRSGNLMLTFTGIVSVIFWVGMAWAIQDVYEKHEREITRPKEEHVELEWLDHRRAYLAAKCVVPWNEVPRLLRLPFAAGAAASVLAALAVFCRASLFFGTFGLTEPIETLVWYGDGGIVRMPGAAAVLLMFASRLASVPLRSWRFWRIRAILAAGARELDARAAVWQAARRREAQLAARSAAREASFEASFDASCGAAVEAAREAAAPPRLSAPLPPVLPSLLDSSCSLVAPSRMYEDKKEDAARPNSEEEEEEEVAEMWEPQVTVSRAWTNASSEDQG